MARTATPVALTTNVLGRLVPEVVNGQAQVPFQGVHGHRVQGRKAAPLVRSAADYPAGGDKRVASLTEALEACGIRDGMTLSTHHHFRDGDFVGNMLFDACGKLGRRDLTWFPSASFPCHAPIMAHMEAGVVHHIEGSLNGPLGDYCTDGRMRGLGVLRSHGGRWQAIQDGEVHIDIAVVAAPALTRLGTPMVFMGQPPVALCTSRWPTRSMPTGSS